MGPASNPDPRELAQLRNIGQVLKLLSAEFVDITIPKIRFLEEKGLIKPMRTPSGYRKFSNSDVDRLRYILTMQRDHYLPLKVIGEHLDAIDEGSEPPPVEALMPAVPKVQLAPEGTPAPESFRSSSSLRMSRKELLKVAGVTEALVSELEEYRLIRASATGHFNADALLIARTAHELGEVGLEPRHLRAFKSAADREAGLINQIAAPAARGRDEAATARAAHTRSEVAALVVRLHATLVKTGLDS